MNDLACHVKKTNHESATFHVLLYFFPVSVFIMFLISLPTPLRLTFVCMRAHLHRRTQTNNVLSLLLLCGLKYEHL